MPSNEKKVDLTIYVVDIVWVPNSYSCHFESNLLLQKHNVKLEPKVLIVNSSLYTKMSEHSAGKEPIGVSAHWVLFTFSIQI